MPTYEYRCNACENEFEIEKRMSDPVEAACPNCGSDRTNRLISHSSFVLKGSGWYVTDYARKNGKGGGETRSRHGGDAKKDAPDTKPADAPAAAPSSPAPSSGGGASTTAPSASSAPSTSATSSTSPTA